MAASLRFYTVVVLPGAVLMALEIVSSRILAPHFGNSVYVWGSIIGVFLAALSLGYYVGGILADRRPELAALGRLLLLAAALQAVVLFTAEPVAERLAAATGGSPAGTLLATALLFGPATWLLATVSPYAVKLATEKLDLLGATAGQLYALSTAGSLAGTLGATFFLIPRLPLGSIFAVLIVATVVAGLAALAESWRRELPSLALASALVVLAFTAPGRSPGGSGRLVDRITPYQTLRVTELGGVRVLRSDGAVHGAVVMESGEPGIAYPRHAAAALLVQPRMERLLVLGLGSGSVGSYLQRRLPELEVEYVEIDPAVREVARDHLLFEEGARTTVHVADARRFFADRSERWDYVYGDTYIGYAVPFHLSTLEFFRLVRDHLAEGGVFGLNLALDVERPFARAVLRTLGEVFRTTYVFQTRSHGLLLLATDGRERLGEREMVARARELDARWSFDPTFSEMARSRLRPDLDLTKVPVLRDRFAPVNHLIHFSRRWEPSGELRAE